MSLSADSETASQQPLLRVSLNQIDYTVAAPGPLDNSSLPVVPVIRIFGNSSIGRKTCVHVHQVYPYFFVDYAGSLKPRHVKSYCQRLTCSINHAIALSLKRNPLSSKSQYIRAIILVKGIPFYGFHSSYSPFLKILVADPAYTNRAVAILRSGTVMSTRFRVYESHLNFPLQFMCDFGLYGCGLVDLKDGWLRCPDDESSIDGLVLGFKRSSYFRQSKLPLEIDTIAPMILNRHSLAEREVNFKTGDPPPALPEDPLVLSVRELWEDERNRRRAQGLHPTPEMPVEPSDSTRGGGAGWVAEARYWEMIRQRIQDESAADPSFSQSQPWERRVMSTFESIEALWDEEWKVWKPTKPLQGETDDEHTNAMEDIKAMNGNDQVDIDISLLSNEDMSDFDTDFVDVGEKVDDQEETQSSEGEDEDHDSENDETNQSDGAEAKTPEECIGDPFELNIGPSQHHGETYRLRSPPSPKQVRSEVGSPSVSGSPTPRRPAGKADIAAPTPEDTTPARRQRLPAFNTLGLPISEKAKGKRPAVTFESPPPEELALSPTKRRKPSTSEDGPASEHDTDHETTGRLQARSSLIAIRTVQLSRVYQTCKSSGTNQYQYARPPPIPSELVKSCESCGVPRKLYQIPYYSKASDAPDRPKEYGGLMYNLKGAGVDSLEEWKPTGGLHCDAFSSLKFDPGGIAGWEYAGQPPNARETRNWLLLEGEQVFDSGHPKKMRSQIEGPTQANIYGLKTSPVGVGDTNRESSNMTILSLEIFVPTQSGGNPNAENDQIVAAFYALHIAGESSIRTGILAVESPAFNHRRLRVFSMDYAENELDLLNKIIDTVVELDPDIITGWEIQGGSWGYLEARGRHFGLDISDLISRAPRRGMGGGSEQWSYRKTSTFQVVGRHVLNAWRIVRSEQTLTIYTFENVVFHVLHRRLPRYSIKTLTEWYNSPVPAHTSLLVQHLTKRAYMVLEVLEEIEIITKTAEFARIFGVDFFSVISRGSQFKVESFMFRIAKPESFVLISPSRADVGRQNAAECMPLIMEPMSAFYTSPLVVLDFQSLYPSIMIAYNYCYSTCLGRVQKFQGNYKFGVVNLDLPSGLLAQFQDSITVAPNGMMYVKPNIRRGLLGRMLVELLDTRVMVKQAMKGIKGDKALKRVLDARQLGLKYIANVTYGYTSATYSGRMPAVEIADSIVQSGRETLEKAIMLVSSTKKWGAQVVYGDTDSMFIYLRGKTKEEAFKIGHEIADTVTSMNPAPIKLKFEKVYLPCVLMAKKRYVGFKYESLDAQEPTFDAKGIETVRRDGVLAQRKMTENTLKILFRTQDLSEVKEYCCRSWAKLLENRASVQDFIFAKEIRMGSYSDNGPPPPGVMVAARKMLGDPNYEPQYAERVPYVIVRGAPGSRLVDRAMDPLDLINNSNYLQLDANYYITRVLIPPLERVFNLVGADVRQWFHEMPKPAPAETASPKKGRDISLSPEKLNIGEHFGTVACLVCGEPAVEGLCEDCSTSPQETIANVGALIQESEDRLATTHLICASCTGSRPSEPIHCESLDCPWLYARRKAEGTMDLIPLYQDMSVELELDMDEQLSQT